MANPYREEIAGLKTIIKQQTGNIRYHKDERRRLVAQAREPNCANKDDLRRRASLAQEQVIFPLRPRARHALLAYGLLRGRPYQRIENSAKKRPDVQKIQQYLPDENVWSQDPLSMKVPIPSRAIETWLSGGCMSLLECMEAHGLLDTSKAA